MDTLCTLPLYRIHVLDVTYGISRGRDTYGYNIVTIRERGRAGRWSCNGVGHGLLGTCFGEWLQDTYQDELQALPVALVDAWYSVRGWTRAMGLNGLTYSPEGKAVLVGGCGLSSMIRIAERLGLHVRKDLDRKGRELGFTVTREQAVSR